MMNRDEIKTFLPHREPMLLVDDVDLQGEIGIAHYHVRGDEYFLQGHYPGYPVVPGVILCEIMAQSSCVLLKDDLTASMRPASNAKCVLATPSRLPLRLPTAAPQPISLMPSAALRVSFAPKAN